MKIGRGVVFGIIVGLIVIITAGLIRIVWELQSVFWFLIGFGILIMISPFVLNSITENKIEREKDEQFLEFSRALVESVESGTPISKSIVNMKYKEFGNLSPHVQKL